MAEKSRARSRERREVGPLPPVRDPGRRARCERDLELFARTYFPNRFPWPFAACHRDSIDRMQTCTHEGGQFAEALPRGSGKTTLGEVEVIRAVVYGFRRFVVLLQATEPLAARSLRKIQRELETNPLLAEDFPEVCYPIQALERIHNRATVDAHQERDDLRYRLLQGDCVRRSPHVLQVAQAAFADCCTSASAVRASP